MLGKKYLYFGYDIKNLNTYLKAKFYVEENKESPVDITLPL